MHELSITSKKSLSPVNGKNIHANSHSHSISDLTHSTSGRDIAESISRPSGNGATEQTIRKALGGIHSSLDITGGVAASSFHKILKAVSQSANGNSSTKKILATALGVALFLSGLVSSFKTGLDIITGKSTQQFKPLGLIKNLMTTYLGIDALGYAQGLNNKFTSTKDIVKRVLPILLLQGCSDMLSNSQSAAYKISSLVGLQSPLKGLLGGLLDNINPTKFFGNREAGTGSNYLGKDK